MVDPGSEELRVERGEPGGGGQCAGAQKHDDPEEPDTNGK